MDANQGSLTLWEAAALVAGLGIGGGVLAVPYLAALNGWLPVVLIIVGSYLVSALMHIMIAEMVVNDGGNHQLVEVLGRFMFRGPCGRFFLWGFFALTLLSFLTLLTGYIEAASEVLRVLLPMPHLLSKFLTYVVAAGFAFYGLKFIAVCEKYALLAVGLLLLVFLGLASQQPLHALPAVRGGLGEGLALFSMVMFCFSAFFAMPQVVKGLGASRKKVWQATFLGLGINAVTVSVITFLAVLVSAEVTKDAMLGLATALGGAGELLGLVFVTLALFTSYWGFSYALTVVLEERLKLSYRRAWLLATLPSFILALVNINDFLGFLRLSGGAMAVLVALLIIPALRRSRKELNLLAAKHFWHWPVVQLLVVAAYIAMTVGALMTGVG